MEIPRQKKSTVETTSNRYHKLNPKVQIESNHHETACQLIQQQNLPTHQKIPSSYNPPIPLNNTSPLPHITSSSPTRPRSADRRKTKQPRTHKSTHGHKAPQRPSPISAQSHLPQTPPRNLPTIRPMLFPAHRTYRTSTVLVPSTGSLRPRQL